MKQAVMIN